MKAEKRRCVYRLRNVRGFQQCPEAKGRPASESPSGRQKEPVLLALNLGLQPPELAEHNIWIVKPPRLWYPSAETLTN